MSEPWDLKELGEYQTTRRRPLSRTEQQDLRDAKLTDWEARLRVQERTQSETDRVQRRAWADIIRERQHLAEWKKGLQFWSVVVFALFCLVLAVMNRMLP